MKYDLLDETEPQEFQPDPLNYRYAVTRTLKFVYLFRALYTWQELNEMVYTILSSVYPEAQQNKAHREPINKEAVRQALISAESNHTILCTNAISDNRATLYELSRRAKQYDMSEV